MTSPDPQILSHLQPASHTAAALPGTSQARAASGKPLQKTQKKKKRRGRVITNKGGGGEGRAHAEGHSTPALLCLSSSHTGRSSGKTPPVPAAGHEHPLGMGWGQEGGDKPSDHPLGSLHTPNRVSFRPHPRGSSLSHPSLSTQERNNPSAPGGAPIAFPNT